MQLQALLLPPRRGILARLLLLLLILATCATMARAATQSVILQPGWNAIFLEVAPNDSSPEAVFAGLPVDQVWAFFPTRSPVQYLSNPAAGLFNVPGWNVWLPAGSRPDAAALSDLRGIIGHQAYLVKNTSTNAATLTVNGAPGVQSIRWNPDSFTLTGLAVDPSTTVRSGDFFFNSNAHKNQRRFQLNPNGTWIPVSETTALAAGRAYWVYTKGGSDFSAPLEVSFGGGRTVDFGPDSERKTITVRNRSAYATNVTLANADGFPLSLQQLDTNGDDVWQPLSSLTRSVPANGSIVLKLGVRRAELASDVAVNLRVSGGGVVLNIPLAAQLPTSSPNRPELAFTEGAPLPPNANAGLWIGTATLNAVSEANDDNAVTATPATFGLRLLIHVDAAGQARLLKEVTLMKGRVPAGDTPPLVLVTNPAQLADFDAPATRDGSPFANRISSVGFDFNGDSVVLGSGFGAQLSGVVVIGSDLATNPFKHKYHPDHDNLNAQFQAPAANLPPDQQEVWGVTRTLQLTFATPPASSADPSVGYSERTGTYQETLSGAGLTRLPTAPATNIANPGLHKNPVVVSGPFTLRRLNTIPTLNAAP